MSTSRMGLLPIFYSFCIIHLKIANICVTMFSIEVDGEENYIWNVLPIELNRLLCRLGVFWSVDKLECR